MNALRLSLRIENFMLVTHDIIKFQADSTVIIIHCHSIYNIQWNYNGYYNSVYCLSHLFNTSIINTSCETSQHPLTTMSLMSSRIPVVFTLEFPCHHLLSCFSKFLYFSKFYFH